MGIASKGIRTPDRPAGTTELDGRRMSRCGGEERRLQGFGEET